MPHKLQCAGFEEFTHLSPSGNSTPGIHPESVLQVSALHYSAGDWVSGGFQTVASAHALRQPTSCGSEYFYNQHPRVRNLIRTEHILNRSEHRVRKEAS